MLLVSMASEEYALIPLGHLEDLYRVGDFLQRKLLFLVGHLGEYLFLDVVVHQAPDQLVGEDFLRVVGGLGAACAHASEVTAG